MTDTPERMTAAEAAREFLHLWHEQIHHGWAAAVPALEAVLTAFSERVRGEAIADAVATLKSMEASEREVAERFRQRGDFDGAVAYSRFANTFALAANTIRALSPTTEPTPE